MKSLLDSPWNYTLNEDEAGHLFLSVVCGTVGVYEVTIKLNKGERAKYIAQGETYIQVLANDICSRPSDFAKRSV